MGLPQIKFDPKYKNPCFLGAKPNPLFNDDRLHCLPYFYLIGVKKSGTSDLFKRISAHPEFRDPDFKEAQWFPRTRFGFGIRSYKRKPFFKETLGKGIDNRSIKFYFTLYRRAAARIQKCVSNHMKGGTYHNCITADATPANLHIHTGWDLLPGNEGLTEPRYTTFHYIKHLTPNAKIIIIFRDPVTRLFSDFLHEMKIRGRLHSSSKMIAKMFHKQTLALMDAYETCFKRFSMRRCLYNETLPKQLQKKSIILAESFRAGFYAFYMQELLSVFRKDQILTVHMGQYLTRTKQTLANTFKFLNMSPLSSRKMSDILKLTVANTAKSDATMYKKTKDLLYTFYKPYNKKMASLMGDSRYLFPQG
ncbi:carbohydrate sulfotransferase 15-like [Mercenaria mercenaria]|uniref:carbohydrate sulfotransferase 15-like n=1 Tax=Mercenaria mercenaria TaxID=6596 RepID=UPI00234F63D1|nr:carbohydrate sulfotransferase 15-like [Mercenaria mercenaria]XP_045177425.2 carbohydrate sulfotransferase 15-like [Mercenaria mercenaria]